MNITKCLFRATRVLRSAHLKSILHIPIRKFGTRASLLVASGMLVSPASYIKSLGEDSHVHSNSFTYSKIQGVSLKQTIDEMCAELSEKKMIEESLFRRTVHRILSFTKSLIYGVRLCFRGLTIACIFFPAFISSFMLFFDRFRVPYYKLLVLSLQWGGPAFMKLGQWAATRPDIFTIEFCKELCVLHSYSNCEPFELIQPKIEKELNCSIYTIFESINPLPIGSGCVSQVYRATLKDTGEEVVVKIKRRDIDRIFQMDMHLILFAASVADNISFFKYMAPKKSATTFCSCMNDQLDFEKEAMNLVRFRDNFKSDDQFVFPRPYLNLTTKNMLVESFEEGELLSDMLVHPESINKEIAHLGILGFLHMMLVDNFLHADLHPGNILVRQSVPCKVPLSKSVTHRTLGLRQSHPQLVFLDVGLVSVLEDSQKQNFIDIFVALANGDGYEAGNLLIIRSPVSDPPPLDPEGYRIQIRDLLARNMDNGVFNLSKMEIASAVAQMMLLSLKHHVVIDHRFMNLFMSVIILEGIGRQIDPEINIILHALPIIVSVIPEYQSVMLHVMSSSKLARQSLGRSLLDSLNVFFKHLFRNSSSSSTAPGLSKYHNLFSKEESEDSKSASLKSIYSLMESSQEPQNK